MICESVQLGLQSSAYDVGRYKIIIINSINSIINATYLYITHRLTD